MRRPVSLEDRAAGVLLHPTSLPGPHGNGDLGAAAYRFADFLAAGRQRWWQMLPVHPVGRGNSPYTALSVFAGSPLLIGLDGLVDDGLLRPGEAEPPRRPALARADYAAARRFREPRLRRAWERFGTGGRRRERRALEAYCEAERGWLEDWALFAALKRAHRGRPWPEWDAGLRRRRRDALARAGRELSGEVGYQRFVQFLFDRQWRALRAYCAARGIGLMGDMPIFVAHDSAEVWAHRELFHLDGKGWPRVVAGVPPDYFSAAGQRWGNPVYRWGVLRRRGYDWWLARIRRALAWYDAVRLDHFIGFYRYWEIAAGEPDAVRGRFRPGPRDAFFQVLRRELGPLPLVAEDLGLVIPEVTALRERFAIPGMRVLQFAFGDRRADNPHLPYNYPRRCVAFTGTHDNDTAVGWFHGPQAAVARRPRAVKRAEQEQALRYLGLPERELRGGRAPPEPAGGIHWAMVRLLLASVANVAIVPVQDLLGLGSEARMNRPGVARGNWTWRLAPGQPAAAVAERLAGLSELYGRASSVEETSGRR